MSEEKQPNEQKPMTTKEKIQCGLLVAGGLAAYFGTIVCIGNMMNSDEFIKGEMLNRDKISQCNTLAKNESGGDLKLYQQKYYACNPAKSSGPLR